MLGGDAMRHGLPNQKLEVLCSHDIAWHDIWDGGVDGRTRALLRVLLPSARGAMAARIVGQRVEWCVGQLMPELEIRFKREDLKWSDGGS